MHFKIGTRKKISLKSFSVGIVVLSIPLGFALETSSVSATTYYVSMTGSGSNSGTQTSPWLTIQQAADAMNAGDTVLVQAGTYPNRVATRRDGSDRAPITFRAQGKVVMNGFDLKNQYNIVDGFEITGNVTHPRGAAIAVSQSASYCQVLNNDIHDLDTSNEISGILLNGPAHCLVAGNGIKRPSFHCIIIGGDSNVISNNWLEAPAGDGIRCFGFNQRICNNVITNCHATGNGQHPDLIQSFAIHGSYASNIVFESNYCVDSASQICQISDDGSTGLVTNWTFRNNVFVRIGLQASIMFPGAKWYNNTFYRCNQVSGAVLGFGYDPAGRRGQSWRGEVKNNAFVECGPTIDDSKRGWHGADARLKDFIAEYNYVGSSGGAPKARVDVRGNPMFSEAHGVNGGDPGFVSPSTGDFHLKSTSVLIDKGTPIPGFNSDFSGTTRPQGNGWDIGAFERR